ncbi:MAG: hypothetical protein JEZ11_12930 [Desulfobacterales bacterium]|nr:hypothetical protein [Desulfobacterales bacterium]
MSIATRIFQKLLYASIDDLRFNIGQSHMRIMRSVYQNVKSLYDVEYKVFSQYGEDGIIDYLLMRLNIVKPKFIEIGVENYHECNTRFLYQDKTSYGVIIDSQKNLLANAKKVLGPYFYMGEIHPISQFINKDNVLDIYNQFIKLYDVDLFSLDIDGIDWWVVNTLPKNFSKIAIIEYNPYFGGKLNVTVPYRSDFNRMKFHHSGLAFGASLLAMVNLMDYKGFAFIGSNINHHNAFFLRKDLVHLLSFKPPSPKIYESFAENFSRESRSSNGELDYAGGTDRLSRIKDIQVVDLSISPSCQVILQQANGFTGL